MSKKSLPPFSLVGLLALLAIFIPGLSFADARSDYLATQRGRAEVPKIIAANAIPCEMAEAFFAGKVTTEIEGKTRDLQVYEVACQGKRGLLLRVASPTTLISATPCDEAEAEKKRNKDAIACVIPANRSNTQWITGWVKPLFPKCEISGVVYVGKAAGTANRIYEVVCKGGQSGGSGFYTLPENVDTLPSPVEPLAYVSCLRARDTEVKCTRTDDKGAIGNYRPLAWQALKGCVPAEARFMGGGKNQLYYEVLCEDRTNLVIVTDGLDRFKGALGCKEAETYGAKCSFGGSAPSGLNTGGNSAGGSAPSDKTKLATYNSALSSLGKLCTASAYNLVGQDSALKRELIEFKCQAPPYGLAGYLPVEGATSAADLTDCFVATLRKFNCRFYPIEAQRKRLSDLADESTAIKPDCVVKDILYVGATADQDLTVEIACENKRGYMAIIAPARDKISRALPCTIAANRSDWEKCTIPGNGTYSGS
ncbi:hypothetical protein [Asticcacaulis sp.]|uniref:hypothetical protein n=1 Tax=Asticcacaulis sp. TaxID=1872648 RepID=UPI002625D27B|nr:hypothetical protein [Asticcacaulis sp.]